MLDYIILLKGVQKNADILKIEIAWLVLIVKNTTHAVRTDKKFFFRKYKNNSCATHSLGATF